MFLLWAVLIGVILGYLCGGRISHLVTLKLRSLWLIFVALIIQLTIFPLFSNRPLLPYATNTLHLSSYALLLVFLVLNYRVFPLLVLGMGSLLNLLVITLNHGYMPSSLTALARAGSKAIADHLLAGDTYGNVVRMSERTRFNLLGDRFYLPHWVPFATAFSLGDLIIGLGLIWLIVWGMRSCSR